jgi:hypothetical protein
MNAAAFLLVALDDNNVGAGPATVLDVLSDTRIPESYRDRDGCSDRALRIWRSFPGAVIGARVMMSEQQKGA